MVQRVLKKSKYSECVEPVAGPAPPGSTGGAVEDRAQFVVMRSHQTSDSVRYQVALADHHGNVLMKTAARYDSPDAAADEVPMLAQAAFTAGLTFK